MRTKREVFRLALVNKLSRRQIAQSCAIDRKTVGKYLDSLPTHLLDYHKIESLNDEELSKALQPKQENIPKGSRPLPDWEQVHQDLQQKGVTLKLVWQEYKRIHPGGYQTTQFNEYYHQWAKKLNPTMRQTHLAGEKLFVDYAGVTVPIRDRQNGQTRQAQIFVAVLGASNYLFAEATIDQSSPSWLGSHVRAFEFFGGVPKMVVPDNLRSGVSKACRYDPDINPAYHKLSVHYDTSIVPARVRKPQDKAKAEQAVQMVERWILAPLRKITFFSLHDLNRRIIELRAKLNERQMQQIGSSRRALFEKIDQPVLGPLPLESYVVDQWKSAKVNIDYHIEVVKHYYSVPYRLIGERVEVRYTEQTVEIFHHNQRVASHLRKDIIGHHTTIKEHMPPAHLEQQKWNSARLIKWAGSIGENTAELAKQILERRNFPEQGFRPVLGILRLGQRYSDERLEQACARALLFGNYRYREIRSILEKGLDHERIAKPAESPPLKHQNIRGKNYFTPSKEESC